MRIVAHESHIRTRAKIGQHAPFVGLAVLAASSVLIFIKPEWLWLTMLLVWIGFLISLSGSYMGDRYVGPLAHHRRVPECLKGLDDSYTLLMYELAAPFVLVEPGGVTVLTPKSQAGRIAYEDGRWHHQQKLSFLRRFAGQEGFGQPHKIAKVERDHVESQLRKAAGSVDGVDLDDVPVRAAILFTHPEVYLELEDEPSVPALRGSEAKRWLRREPLRPQLNDEEHAALLYALGVDDEELSH